MAASSVNHEYMELSSLIKPEHVITNIMMTTKKQALQELANRTSALTGIEAREIFEGLLERERLGSTGVGHGIAIPHTKLKALDRIYCLFMKLELPIDFDAVDNEPVDLIWLLLAPTSAGSKHLKALHRVSRILREEDIRSKIRAESNALAIHALLAARSGKNPVVHTSPKTNSA